MSWATFFAQQLLKNETSNAIVTGFGTVNVMMIDYPKYLQEGKLSIMPQSRWSSCCSNFCVFARYIYPRPRVRHKPKYRSTITHTSHMIARPHTLAKKLSLVISNQEWRQEKKEKYVTPELSQNQNQFRRSCSQLLWRSSFAKLTGSKNTVWTCMR